MTASEPAPAEAKWRIKLDATCPAGYDWVPLKGATYPQPKPVNLTRTGIMALRGIGATSTGLSHRDSGLPCQDKVRMETVADRFVIGALADGLGSAKCSDVGAELAVNCAASIVAKQVADWPDSVPTEEQVRSLFVGALEEARQSIAALCAREGADLHDYACTLLIVVCSETWVAGMNIGDGFIGLRLDGDEDARVLLPPERGEFANTVHSIVGDDAIEHCRIALSAGESAFVVVSSDGMMELALKYIDWKPHQPFFRFVESVARDDLRENNGSLEALLGAPRVDELSTDDKSLICVVDNNSPRSDQPSRSPDPSQDDPMGIELA